MTLNINIKIIIYILLSIFTFSCSGALKQEIEATMFFEKNILSSYLPENHPNVKISVIRTDIDTISFPQYDIIRTNSNIAYICTDYDEYYLFTHDSVYMVSNENCELMSGKAGERFYEVFYGHFVENSIEFIEPLLFPKERKYTFENMKDSIISGDEYKILQKEFRNSMIFDDSTKEFDIPNFYNVSYYYNKKKGLIEYICAMPTKESSKSCKQEYHLSYSFEDPQLLIDSIFDFHQQKYENYSKHNDNFLPYSWTYTKTEIPSKLSSPVLNFPIVSLIGDTTTIGQEEGWLLLDFWWFSCRSCIEWVATTSKEKTEHGQRILESNGIKIMSINAISDNKEKLSETAQKYNAADIIYHAKGMGELINIYYMPQYYLVSPDKKIVLKTNDLGDYSEVLKVKQKWESKHKRK